jgi:citrate lyase beta subunit
MVPLVRRINSVKASDVATYHLAFQVFVIPKLETANDVITMTNASMDDATTENVERNTH